MPSKVFGEGFEPAASIKVSTTSAYWTSASVRLSAGIEDVDDLLVDLDRALSAVV